MDLQGQNGLLRTYRQAYRRRGATGVLASLALIVFYVWMYWEEKLSSLGLPPVFSRLGAVLHLDSRWYLYGALYTITMGIGAALYLREHGNSRYNRIRIGVNVGVQVLLGFSLPFWMHRMGEREYYFSYLWPLKIEYLYPTDISQYPVYLIVYSLLASLVAMPWLALRYGKRWYCSWVCGCGGLANTFGDPWRHLTSTSTRSWRFEKVTVHTTMGVALLSTALVTLDFLIGDRHASLHAFVAEFRGYYGFVVGAVLAGVAGVGLYPLVGPRFWCRNFCPMAAMLGLIQKLGRYRIRVKQDMCISCGNCSTYCEMGIDVRAYAERNESFTRASCVGCGMCAHVCPRGVLRLENEPRGKRRRSLVVLQA